MNFGSVPERCACCRAKLRGVDPDPERHQVADLPKIEPVVKEYRVHTLGFTRCGHATRGELPKGTPTGAFGPGVVATVAELVGVYGGARPMPSEGRSHDG